MSKIKKLAGETVLYGLGSIVPRALNFLLVPLHTRNLFSPEEYGVVTNLLAYVAFLNIVYTFGMETAYFRFATLAGNDQRKIFNLAQTSVLLISVLGISVGWGQGDSEYGLHVLSSRPDMVSGNDVLIEADIPEGTRRTVKVTLNGHDVTAAFRAGSSQKLLLGRFTGLQLGKNTLELMSGGTHKAAIELSNHPVNGPLFSGPHQQPFFCRTGAAGLGPALDRNCSAKTQIAYFYKSTQAESDSKDLDVGSLQKLFTPAPQVHDCAAAPCGWFRYLGFKAYDPGRPRPADMAQSTTWPIPFARASMRAARIPMAR